MRTFSFRAVSALAAAALLLAACGSDDATPEVPEGGTGSAYNDAILAADSHHEIIFPTGGDMVVAVDCESPTGGTIVTVVAEGLEPGIYIGTFDPSTGVNLSLEVSGGPGYAVGASQMTLAADEYTVTFADIDGGVFPLRGC